MVQENVKFQRKLVESYPLLKAFEGFKAVTDAASDDDVSPVCVVCVGVSCVWVWVFARLVSRAVACAGVVAPARPSVGWVGG